jgi:hypothetical protein
LKKKNGNNMPVSVKKMGDKYRVVGPDGKPETRNGKPVDGGGHSSKKDAVSQVQAINLSQRRKEGKSAPPKPLTSSLEIAAKKKFADLIKAVHHDVETHNNEESPPIMIVSDGTPEGTHLILHGQVVHVDSMHFSCSSGEFAYCDMTITQRDVESGMERSMTLRKERGEPSRPLAQTKKFKDIKRDIKNGG